jgi:hypothetical protein
VTAPIPDDVACRVAVAFSVPPPMISPLSGLVWPESFLEELHRTGFFDDAHGRYSWQRARRFLVAFGGWPL